MTRTVGLLLACGVRWAAAHPLCYYNDRPTDFDHKLKFCPPAQDGACCTDMEEDKVKNLYYAAGDLSPACGKMYKQVVCGVCHSYSAHLYEVLGSRVKAPHGMTMKRYFCEELVEKCGREIDFPTYEGGKSYCDMHVGDGKDRLWSYPYMEPEIFEPGLMKLFPDLSNKRDFPKDTISVRQTPDGEWWWLMGQRGEIKKVHVENLGQIDGVVDISKDIEIQNHRGNFEKKSEFYEAYEEGLLDIAFDPLFEENNFFYLSYTCILDDGELQRNRLSKFVFYDDSARATRSSEVVLLTTIPKYNSIHAAGWCGFKPSDYTHNNKYHEYHDIYWTTGDGGPQTDPLNVSQNDENMLGSMMRISVPSFETSGDPYRIPHGNLQGGHNTKREICASGLRNPFRCGFDSANDKLYCGDVGHTNVEEVNLIKCGKNYGWSRFEGTRCQEAVEDNEFNPKCRNVDRSRFEWPYFEYCHPDYHSDKRDEDEFTGGNDFCGNRRITGHAVIGGYVYRGETFADLLGGAYIFGDAKNRNIYFLKEEAGGKLSTGTIVSDGSVAVISFAETIDKEIVLITKNHNIFKLPCGDLCATTCLKQAQYPPKIKSLGCFSDDKRDRPLLTLEKSSCGTDEKKMSPAICASYCSTIRGAVYAGVKDSSKCFCGSARDISRNAGDLPSGKCQMLCTATPDEFCGGMKATEVFKLEFDDNGRPPAPDSSDYYVGCYADDRNDRIMDTRKDSDKRSMTNERCRSKCTDYKYYGTQAGRQCWCSDRIPGTFDPRFESNCDIRCPGDRAEKCGGDLAMSIYKYENTSPTPTPGHEYEHVGCYEDNSKDRVLSGRKKRDSKMTTDLCFNFCKRSPYFGTEYGTECYCGDHDDEPEKRHAASCNTPCPGDRSENCGGGYAIDIYRPVQNGGGSTTPSVTPGYVGCFADHKKSRIMKKSGSKKNMSSQLCKERCEGSKFYGMQSGRTCWCGDSDDYDRHGEARDDKCNKRCRGNKNEYCGGRLFTSVYAY